MNPDDILLWPDGTWCYSSDLSEYAFMSDDYEVIKVGTIRHIKFLEGENSDSDI